MSTTKGVLLSAAIMFSLITSCNQNNSGDEAKDSDTSSAVMVNDSIAPTDETVAYDPAKDPMVVGPQFVQKLADTLNVKMYIFTIKPGDTVSLHSHPDHLVYVLQGGTASISFDGKPPQNMEMKTGQGFVSGALTDAGKNVGKTTIKLLVADIYRPRGK